MLLNYGAKTVTGSATGAASSSATATGVAGKSFQVISWGGTAPSTAASVELVFDGTTVLKYNTTSGNMAGEYYGEVGPVAQAETDVVVTTKCLNGAGAATVGNSNSNLVYHIIM